jgi:hypothetical protein
MSSSGFQMAAFQEVSPPQTLYVSVVSPNPTYVKHKAVPCI